MSIDLVEALWIILNASTFLLTLVALSEALADRDAVHKLNGAALELASDGIVRREQLRLVMQGLLLALVVPGLFDDRPTPLNFFVVTLMALPAILLVSSLLDARDRRKMAIINASDLLTQQKTALAALQKTADDIAAAVAENTLISQLASDNAKEAYHEANSVNEKIAAQGETLIDQGKDRDRVESVIDDTHQKVVDIHSRGEVSS